MIDFFKRLWARLFPKPQDWVLATHEDILVNPRHWRAFEDDDAGVFVLTNVDDRTRTGPGAMITWSEDDGVIDGFVFGLGFQAGPLTRADRKVLMQAIEDWSDSLPGDDFWVSWHLNRPEPALAS